MTGAAPARDETAPPMITVRRRVKSRGSVAVSAFIRPDATLGRRPRSSTRMALEARPAEESARVAIRAAFLALRAEKDMGVDELAVARMYHEAPSLRARHLEKHLRRQVLLAPDVQRRLGLPDSATPDPRARAFVAAALACLDAALDAWCESDGAADPVRLFDDAVAALRA